MGSLERFLGLFLIGIMCIRPTYARADITDGEIRGVLERYVERDRNAIGIVVGIVDAQGSRVVAYGRRSKNSSDAVDGNTVFEIGSVTKLFTSTLLADMVNRGEVKLDDPISKYLPPNVRVPTRGGQQISLLHLATHTSGLPRDPDCTNLLCTNLWAVRNVYSSYRMYDYLSKYKLPRDIGSKYEYSNFGFALLGQVLVMRAGSDYDTLLRTRILERLQMKDTAHQLTAEMSMRLAAGYDNHLKAVKVVPEPKWYQGAGSLYSTVNDLLRFLAANLDGSVSPIYPAMQLTHESQHAADAPGMDTGLGWSIIHPLKNAPGPRILQKGGFSSNGYRSFVAIDQNLHRGVVVLWNSTKDLEHLGIHLLQEQYDLLKQHHAISLVPKVFDEYAGVYEFEPGLRVEFSRSGDRFFARTNNGKRVEIYPESETGFFWTIVDAQVTFVKDGSGFVTRIVHRQNGLEYTAERVR